MNSSTTGQGVELSLDSLRDPLTEGYGYLNAFLFLPFQKLSFLDLSCIGLSRWVSKEGLFTLYAKSRTCSVFGLGIFHVFFLPFFVGKFVGVLLPLQEFLL